MQTKTIIIGGGFAGRQACRALSRSNSEVVLIDPRAEAVMLPSLPDLAGGWIAESALCGPFSKLIPSSVQHLRCTVSSIDLENKTLIADGQTLSFDYLLIASGSVVDFHGFSQHLDRIHHLDSLESALRIRESFTEYLHREEEPHLVMAGGGYTGLELAATLYYRARAENRPCRVTVVDPGDKLLPFLPDEHRKTIERFLAENDITVLNNSRVAAFSGTDVLAGGQVFQSVFFCWTGGSRFAIPEVKGEVDALRDGRLRVNADLSLPGYPDLFAAGDAAAVEHKGAILRKAVNFSWYAGKCAGRNIARRVAGKPTRPFRPVDAGWIIPLHTVSVGQLFSHFWVKDRTGLRLHYLMCGVRNYRLSNVITFAGIALKLFNKEVPHED